MKNSTIKNFKSSNRTILCFGIFLLLFCSCHITDPDGSGSERIMSCKIDGSIWIAGVAAEGGLGWTPGGRFELNRVASGFSGVFQPSRLYHHQETEFTMKLKRVDTGSFVMEGADSVFIHAEYRDANGKTFSSAGQSGTFRIEIFDTLTIVHDTLPDHYISSYIPRIKGTFRFNLSNGTDTIHITDGVFDLERVYID